MNNSHFQTRYQGAATFACAICGHNTRLSGQNNDSLCKPCEDLAGTENEVFDGCADEGTVRTRDKLLDKIVKRGGNVDAVRKSFKALFAFKP